MAFTRLIGLNFGSSQSGIPLRATLVNISGINLSGHVNISDGFTELGSGKYLWNYTNFPSNTRFAAKFINADGSGLLATYSFNPEVDTSEEESGEYVVVITVKDQNSDIVADALVQVFPSGNTTSLIYSNQTNDSAGQVTFSVDGGDYDIYVSKPMWGSWNNPYHVSIENPTTLILTGTSFVVIAPTAANTVRLYTYTADIGLTPKAGVEMLVYTSGVTAINNDYYILSKPSTSHSDGDGYVYDDISANIDVRLTIPKAEVELYFKTPASGTLNVASLL